MGLLNFRKAGQAARTDIFDPGSSYYDVGEDHPLPMTLGTRIAGEDQANGLIRVEPKYESLFHYGTGGVQIFSGSGVIHSITVGSSTGATNGLITTLYVCQDTSYQFGTLKFALSNDTAIPFGTHILDMKFAAPGAYLQIVSGSASLVTVTYRIDA